MPGIKPKYQLTNFISSQWSEEWLPILLSQAFVLSTNNQEMCFTCIPAKGNLWSLLTSFLFNLVTSNLTTQSLHFGVIIVGWALWSTTLNMRISNMITKMYCCSHSSSSCLPHHLHLWSTDYQTWLMCGVLVSRHLYLLSFDAVQTETTSTNMPKIALPKKSISC